MTGTQHSSKILSKMFSRESNIAHTVQCYGISGLDDMTDLSIQLNQLN